MDLIKAKLALRYPDRRAFLYRYALKSVPGLDDVGVPHGGEDSSRSPARGSRSKKYTPHADMHEKLKG